MVLIASWDFRIGSMVPRANDFPTATKKIEVAREWAKNYFIIDVVSFRKFLKLLKRFNIPEGQLKILETLITNLLRCLDIDELYHVWFEWRGMVSPNDKQERSSLLMVKEASLFQYFKDYQPVDNRQHRKDAIKKAEKSLLMIQNGKADDVKDDVKDDDDDTKNYEDDTNVGLDHPQQ